MIVHSVKTWKKGMEISCEQAGHSQVHKRDNSSPFLGTTYFRSARAHMGLHWLISSGPLELFFGFPVDLAKEVCERQSNLTTVAITVCIQYIFVEYLLYDRHCARYWGYNGQWKTLPFLMKFTFLVG